MDTPALDVRPVGKGRPGYLEFMRSQFRFSPVWMPAVLVACYIQWRAGGWLRVALLVLIAGPAALMFATWWEWRKTKASVK